MSEKEDNKIKVVVEMDMELFNKFFRKEGDDVTSEENSRIAALTVMSRVGQLVSNYQEKCSELVKEKAEDGAEIGSDPKLKETLMESVCMKIFSQSLHDTVMGMLSPEEMESMRISKTEKS